MAEEPDEAGINRIETRSFASLRMTGLRFGVIKSEAKDLFYVAEDCDT